MYDDKRRATVGLGRTEVGPGGYGWKRNYVLADE